MNKDNSQPILVIGGTGTQGGNVAKELLKNGHRVRILSRNPASPEAKKMEQLNAEIVKGDLADIHSLARVMEGISALFSAQYADPNDPTVELRNTSNMVKVAQDMGVKQIIHTSVVGTNIFPRWDKSPILTHFWESKYKAEELIRHAGFQSWTILHPSWFMENFTYPLAGYMAPELKNGKLFGVLHPDTPIKLSCGEDTAKLARIGFENPELFKGKDINIAGDELSITQVAVILTEVTGKKVVYEEISAEEAVRRGLLEGTVQSHSWMNERPGWGFDLNEIKAYGVPLKSFKQWISENKANIMVD